MVLYTNGILICRGLSCSTQPLMVRFWTNHKLLGIDLDGVMMFRKTLSRGIFQCSGTLCVALCTNLKWHESGRVV